MKDKVAKKRKKKRQMIRQEERHKEEEQLLKRFEKVAKEHNIKKFNKQKALQSYRIVESEAISDGVIYSVMFAAWYLHIKCGYNYIRIAQFIDSINHYGDSLKNNLLTVPKMIDEMKRESGFDYDELMSDFDPLKLRTSTAEEDKIKMAVCKMQAVLPTVLYVFYFRLGWKKKRMNAVGNMAKQIMQDAPKGKMKEIREVLRKDCGMIFYSDGHIDYLKAK